MESQRDSSSESSSRPHLEKLEHLTELASEAIISIDNDQSIRSLNPAAQRMLGYDRDSPRHLQGQIHQGGRRERQTVSTNPTPLLSHKNCPSFREWISLR
jgi:PAS domain-containing protein